VEFVAESGDSSFGLSRIKIQEISSPVIEIFFRESKDSERGAKLVIKPRSATIVVNDGAVRLKGLSSV